MTNPRETDSEQGGVERPPPRPMPRAVVCPYCGHISSRTTSCEVCQGHFDPLSRQATQNAMGPWFIRDASVPTRPGCSYETLTKLVGAGKVRRDAVVRGPTTRQFWMLATRVPGIAHLLGTCHNCQQGVSDSDYACGACGAVFEIDRDRQHLGVGPIRLLPGQAAPEMIAAATGGPPDIDGVEAAGKSGGESESEPDARVRRLERRASEQRIQLRIAIGAVVVLAGLLLFSWSTRGSNAAPDGTVVDASGETPEAPIPVAADLSVESGVVDDGPIEDAAEVPEPSGWEALRARVVDALASDSRLTLENALAELRAWPDPPAEAADLVAALEERIAALKVRRLP